MDILYRDKIVVVTPPKAGSSSVDSLLQSAQLQATAYSGPIGRTINKHTPIPPEDVRDGVRRGEWKALLLVRNPYRRALSLWKWNTSPRTSFARYVNLREGRFGSVISGIDWRHWQCGMYGERFATACGIRLTDMYVVRIEHVMTDLAKHIPNFFTRLQRSPDSAPPHNNRSQRPDPEIISADCTNAIKSWGRIDFTLGRYDPDDVPLPYLTVDDR